MFKLPEPFRIETRADGDRTYVVPAGELDLSTVGELSAAVAAARTGSAARIVVDLRELSFIDSSGIGLLLELARAEAAAGARLEMLDGAAPVARVIDISGARSLLPFAPE